jgi:hypothetical protein
MLGNHQTRHIGLQYEFFTHRIKVKVKYLPTVLASQYGKIISVVVFLQLWMKYFSVAD